MCIPIYVQSRHTFYVGNNQKSVCKCSAHKPHSLTSVMFCIVYRGVSEPYDSHVRPIQQSWETLLVLRLFPRRPLAAHAGGACCCSLLLLLLFRVHNTHDLGGTTRSRDAQGTLVKRAMECLALFCTLFKDAFKYTRIIGLPSYSGKDLSMSSVRSAFSR